jgi:hypothetical protein
MIGPRARQPPSTVPVATGQRAWKYAVIVADPTTLPVKIGTLARVYLPPQDHR